MGSYSLGGSVSNGGVDWSKKTFNQFSQSVSVPASATNYPIYSVTGKGIVTQLFLSAMSTGGTSSIKPIIKIDGMVLGGWDGTKRLDSGYGNGNTWLIEYIGFIPFIQNIEVLVNNVSNAIQSVSSMITVSLD